MRSTATILIGALILTFCFHGRPLAAEPLVLDRLFQLKGIQGTVEAKRATDEAFESAIHDRAYPYGTTLRTGPKGIARILISNFQDFITVGPNSLVLPDLSESNSAARVIRFLEGDIEYSLSRAMAEAPDLLSIAAPMTVVDRLKGEGQLKLSRRDGLHTLRLEPRTEAIRVTGWQFAVPSLNANSVLEISSSANREFTSLKNIAGDFTIVIEKGETDEEPARIDMSPMASVSIWREFAPVGGRLLVSVLVNDPRGRCIDQFAFPTDITLDEVTQAGDFVRFAR